MQPDNFNSTSLIERFKIHLSQNFKGIESKKLLLAISGGIDSVVLFDLMKKLGFDLSLAHANFELRGKESEQDEAFVRELAKQNQAVLHVEHFDTRKYADHNRCSIQMAARELRYRWFDRLMTEKGYELLLTAHHSDDNLETFFINLIRGTGIDGLCGIPEKSGQIIRPLLPFSRIEIHTYARNQRLKWREDLSNFDDKYLRNKIRLKLIPLLREINPAFGDTFNTTLDNLKSSRKMIRDHMRSIIGEVESDTKGSQGVIKAFKVKELEKYAANSAYLYQLFHPYGFGQFDDIRSLLRAQSGKLVFSGTHRLLKSRELLLLSEIPEPKEDQAAFSIDDRGGSVTLGNSTLSFETSEFTGVSVAEMSDPKGETAFFDKDLLHFPLTVRKWKNGDYFYPLGMRGKKKLSKYFKDEKYSGIEKENIWLLCSGNDIIWVIGKRMDDRYKLSAKTRTILKATLNT